MSNGNPNPPQPRRDPYRLVGEVFDGRYRIEAFVSSGSFGAVYRAVNIRVGKTVAVKVLKPDLKDELAETARELFKREGLTIGNLDHPHIVNIIDVGEEFDFAYMVMEWLEGRTLEAEIKSRKTFSPEDAAKILSDIADALHTAHEQGIVHRDIKPSNIHLGREEKNTVKVLDFGIAKVISSASQAMASRVAGTLEYASPEQVSGGMIDRRSDIYSLGVMMYQMLAGELPFKANSEAHLIQMHLMEPPPKLTEKRGDLSEGVSAVIEKAMAKSSEDRFQTALEFKQAFVDSFSNTKKYFDSSDMQTLLAVTKASPLETEEYSPPKDSAQDRKIDVRLVDDTNDLKTDAAKKETHQNFLDVKKESRQDEQTLSVTSIERRFYTLSYTLGGALFALIFGYFFWQEIPYSYGMGEPLFAVDIPCGALLGLILSEMRPHAWWSVAKHRRLSAFVIYALTGAAVLYGGRWLLFHLDFFFWNWSRYDISHIAEIYDEKRHRLVNEFVAVLIPVGIILGLIVCGVRVALHREKESAEIKTELLTSESKSNLRIYLTIGVTVLSFIVSLIFYFITRTVWGYEEASFFRVIHHTLLGAALGIVVGQLLRPSGAGWSVTDGYQGKSILVHGFTLVFIISLAGKLQFLCYTFIEVYDINFVKEFLMRNYIYDPVGAVFLIRSAIFYFIAGVIIWFARLLAYKMKRPGLIYTLCGLVCSFVLSWIEITPQDMWIPYLLLNTLLGTMFFASVSELRRGALWSVEKGRRIKAFLVHGATGITVVMGIGWLLWFFYIFTETRLGFHLQSVYILLALLALAGFILGLIVCGARVAVSEAMSAQKTN